MMAKDLVTTTQRTHVHLNKDTNCYYFSGKYCLWRETSETRIKNCGK